jgi:hypothetical protein
MKIKDFISKNIQEYPTLFKDADYEKSKLKVLDHTFFVIGNGLDFADTENPNEGGYIVDSKYKFNEKTYEYDRIKDKPYGQEKYKDFPKDYFESDVYYVSFSEPLLDMVHKKESLNKDRIYLRYKRNDGEPNIYLANSTYEFKPYPFSKEYSLGCRVLNEGLFLQDDWMEELIFLCKKTLEFFNNESQYKRDAYYPNENDYQKDLRHFETKYQEKGVEGIKHLRDIWGYEIKETIPTIEEIKERKQQVWIKYYNNQVEFLTKYTK